MAEVDKGAQELVAKKSDAWTDLGLRAYGRIMNGNPAFFASYEASS